MFSVSQNPFEPTEPAFWFWDRLEKKTHIKYSEQYMVEHLMDVSPKREDSLQFRRESIYALQSTTPSGHIILEMTGLGKVDYWMEELKKVSERHLRRFEVWGEDRIIEWPKYFANAPPRYIILHPDGEEDEVHWSDCRGIEGWLSDQRRAERLRTQRTTRVYL